jgi:hypothetical protein
LFLDGAAAGKGCKEEDEESCSNQYVWSRCREIRREFHILVKLDMKPNSQDQEKDSRELCGNKQQG